MRAVVVVIVIAIVLVLVGWLQFGIFDGDPTIRMNTDKVKQDTSAIVDETRNAAEEIDRRVDVDVDVDTSRETP
jgi:hypothetical protein